MDGSGTGGERIGALGVRDLVLGWVKIQGDSPVTVVTASVIPVLNLSK